MNVTYSERGQAIPTHVERLTPRAFDKIENTQVR